MYIEKWNFRGEDVKSGCGDVGYFNFKLIGLHNSRFSNEYTRITQPERHKHG